MQAVLDRRRMPEPAGQGDAELAHDREVIAVIEHDRPQGLGECEAGHRDGLRIVEREPVSAVAARAGRGAATRVAGLDLQRAPGQAQAVPVAGIGNAAGIVAFLVIAIEEAVRGEQMHRGIRVADDASRRQPGPVPVARTPQFAADYRLLAEKQPKQEKN